MKVSKLFFAVYVGLLSCITAHATDRMVNPYLGHCIISLHDKMQFEQRLDELSADFNAAYTDLQNNIKIQPQDRLVVVIKELERHDFFCKRKLEMPNSNKNK